MTVEEAKKEAATSHNLLAKALAADEDSEILDLADRYLKATADYREAVQSAAMESNGGKTSGSAHY
jgi:hypothetical protein